METSIKKTDKKFADTLIDAIDEALDNLGESAKLSLYFNLEVKFALPKQKIPTRISDFSDAMDQIFGAGARYLEILIMKCLHAKVKANYKWEGPSWLVPDLTFEKYIALMELSYNDHNKIGDLEIVVDGIQQQRNEIHE